MSIVHVTLLQIFLWIVKSSDSTCVRLSMRHHLLENNSSWTAAPEFFSFSWSSRFLFVCKWTLFTAPPYFLEISTFKNHQVKLSVKMQLSFAYWAAWVLSSFVSVLFSDSSLGHSNLVFSCYPVLLSLVLFYKTWECSKGRWRLSLTVYKIRVVSWRFFVSFNSSSSQISNLKFLKLEEICFFSLRVKSLSHSIIDVTVLTYR